jgi:hypothetical protein
MRIIEITRPEHMYQANSHLSMAGYEDLMTKPGHDEGKYSTVLYKPGMSYVVKLFKTQDSAYLSYLKLITSISNPHFPVVRGKPTKVNNEYYAVRLEYLTPINRDNERILRELAETCLTYLELSYNNKYSQNESYFQEKMRDAARQLPPTLRKAISLIYVWCIKGLSDIIIDLHRYNAMMRGNTMVIIDPIQPSHIYVE